MNAEVTIESDVHYFGDFELDAARQELRSRGEVIPVQSRPFELLLHLARNRHRVVDKDELQTLLWPKSIVTENSLTRCVMKARRAVGDDAGVPSIIKTIHGRGYRFVGDVRVETQEETAAHQSARKPVVWRKPLFLTAGGFLLAAVLASWIISTPTVSDSARVAVLPVENATGNAELDWARTGLMALMGRMLETQQIEVIDADDVIDLAGDRSTEQLIEAESDFRRILQKISAPSHVVGVTLGRDNELLRLTFVVSSSNGNETRTIVGDEPTTLARDAVATITKLVTAASPQPERMNLDTTDSFLGEAYARGMALQFEGRYAEARRLFQVIIEQEPSLFWPRFEFALAARNMRDYEEAESLFDDLLIESFDSGDLARQAAVQNSLGIIYMRHFRNDEALAAFNAVAEISGEISNTHYLATANTNLGLLAKNQGDLAIAFEYFQNAERVRSEAGIQSHPGVSLHNMAGLLIQMGRLDEAEQQAVAAIDSFQLTGKRLYEGYALSRLATIYRRRGLLEEAENTTLRARSIREELDDKRGIAISLQALAEIAFERGNLTRSDEYAQQALDIGKAIHANELIGDALAATARVQVARGRFDDAARNYIAADEIARSHDEYVSIFRAQRGLARVAIGVGDYAGAFAISDQLTQQARESDRQREEVVAMELRGEIYMALEQWQDAIMSLEQILAASSVIDDDSLLASVRTRLATCHLELGDATTAALLVEQVLSARPADANILRLKARLAADNDQPDDAVTFMSEARLLAAETWSNDDDALLEEYRSASYPVEK